ncbi:putative parvulintype peptidyl-prolyl cis/trans isomerase [Monocercomonoides exilis]|uniref:putative parvulintype peptidyl-prolyl cis/trans isomerase n=1 Tax=Monocercomonoides exilis TaxID=2049356 RepID=UPI0035595991|nr:putative parvulintype peptidyl-prolyl cis/trans isomerase [Monocercomonoides exilis]
MSKRGSKGSGKKESKAISSDKGLSPCTHVHARHILCEKQSKILQALAELESGKNFPDVAKDYSEDKARHGGDLGWFPRGAMAGPFEEVAFSTPVGQRSAPFKTVHGWHIVYVEGRK